jgi:hypothetical protein
MLLMEMGAGFASSARRLALAAVSSRTKRWSMGEKIAAS